MEKDQVEVDVVVPVLNGGERFRQCLEALNAQRDVRARILVADNGSTDGSGDIARALGAVVVIEPRRSSYAARNRALAETTAPIVAFTDADCVADPYWLRTGIDVMTDKGWDLCAGAIHQERGATLAGRYDEATYVSQEHYVRFGFGATGNLFVRRSVIEEIGPFLGTLESGGDLELGRRAVAAGKRLGFAAQAAVRHPPRETLHAVLRKSWRIGKGHAAVGRYHPSVLRWGLSPRRLLPDGHVLRTYWRQPAIVAIDVLNGWVAWVARVVAVISARRTDAGRAS